MRTKNPTEDTMKTTLDVLKLGTRTASSLAGAGIKTLSDLTACSPNDLRKKRNIGAATLREIAEALHRHGLYLRGSEPPASLVPAMYTVVVAQPSPTALPTMAYVLPTGSLSARTFQDFRDAAEKGGCTVSMFTVGDSGIEHVKWELMHYGSTKVD
jgi:NAD-dependent DNA ligase